jgi:hypothetical protein
MRIVVESGEFDVRDARISVFNTSNLRRIDWFMALVVMALVFCGWLALYSASQYSPSGYFSRQVVAFFVGIAVAATIIVIDYRFVVLFAPALYVGAVGALAAVLAFGHTAKGSERWLQLGPIGIQPSEVTKLIMVYFLAWYLNLLGDRIKKFHWFVLDLHPHRHPRVPHPQAAQPRHGHVPRAAGRRHALRRRLQVAPPRPRVRLWPCPGARARLADERLRPRQV